jgi:hypothetical protein
MEMLEGVIPPESAPSCVVAYPDIVLVKRRYLQVASHQPRGALGRRTHDLRRALSERPSRAGEAGTGAGT